MGRIRSKSDRIRNFDFQKLYLFSLVDTKQTEPSISDQCYFISLVTRFEETAMATFRGNFVWKPLISTRKKKIIEGFHRMHYIKESRTKINILKTTCTWCSLLKDDSKTILSKVVFQIFWLYVVSALKIKKERQITGDVSFPEKKTSRDTTRFFIGQICVFHQILQAEMTCHDSINYKMQDKKTYRMDSWPWWACLPPAAPTRPRRWWPSLWEYVADY